MHLYLHTATLHQIFNYYSKRFNKSFILVAETTLQKGTSWRDWGKFRGEWGVDTQFIRASVFLPAPDILVAEPIPADTQCNPLGLAARCSTCVNIKLYLVLWSKLLISPRNFHLRHLSCVFLIACWIISKENHCLQTRYFHLPPCTYAIGCRLCLAFKRT
jgi:hypothetical protein